MSTERDTHFLGFAKLLVDELGHLAADHYRWPALSAQEAIRDGGIPDLTTLPPAAPESAAG